MSLLAERFWAKVEVGTPDECWPWTAGRDRDGYGRSRRIDGNTLAHRIAYALTFGRIPGPVVRHSCDNPPCCNPDHLLAGTQAENVRDACERHRGGRWRLDSTAVETIRESGERPAVLAERLGVSVTTISMVRNRRTWA